MGHGQQGRSCPCALLCTLQVIEEHLITHLIRQAVLVFLPDEPEEEQQARKRRRANNLPPGVTYSGHSFSGRKGSGGASSGRCGAGAEGHAGRRPGGCPPRGTATALDHQARAHSPPCRVNFLPRAEPCIGKCTTKQRRVQEGAEAVTVSCGAPCTGCCAAANGSHTSRSGAPPSVQTPMMPRPCPHACLPTGPRARGASCGSHSSSHPSARHRPQRGSRWHGHSHGARPPILGGQAARLAGRPGRGLGRHPRRVERATGQHVVH